MPDASSEGTPMLVADTLTPAQFDRIAAIAKARWGLALTPAKLQLVTSRVCTFMRRSRFSDVSEYLHFLDTSASEKDHLEFFDLLSTNVTSFFRDRAHYDYLERELFTGLSRGTLSLPGRKLRIWSAGCSTGCEPYTLAMLVHDHLKDLKDWDIQILATDLSNYAVQEAHAGTYGADVVKDLPSELRSRHFDRKGESLTVKPHIRSLVKVAQLNLMDKWPMSGPFDVIFCRNVMIYFDTATRQKLVGRFARLLRPGGIFAVGSAETLAGMNVDLKSAMPSLYIK